MAKDSGIMTRRNILTTDIKNGKDTKKKYHGKNITQQMTTAIWTMSRSVRVNIPYMTRNF